MQLLKVNRDRLAKIRTDTMKRTIWYYTENGFGTLKEDMPVIPNVSTTISDSTAFYVSSSSGIQPRLAVTTNVEHQPRLTTANSLSHLTCSSIADASTVSTLGERVNQLEEQVSDMREQMRRILDAQHLLFRQETGDRSS